MNYAVAFAAGAALCLSLWRPVEVSASPVLLSLDVEEPGDDQALRRLDIRVPATYFITGQFAEEHREVVAALSKSGNTIGSHSYDHPHFKSLDPVAIDREITASKNLLESITGKPVAWFRAPYLEYDQRVLNSLRDNGFIGDSSDKDAWASQDLLFEIPISNFLDSSKIASDYDLLEESHYTGKQFEAALIKMYEEKAPSGEPLVILLHPSVSSKQSEALKSFIDTVRRAGGEFVTFDGYMAAVHQHRPIHRAVWLDMSRGVRNPAATAASLSGLGATDVFLMATDARGDRFYGDRKGHDSFGRTVALLRSKGLKVHAWISALADRKAIGKHPEWSMVAKDGTRSTEWMSPANPEVVAYLARTVKTLIKSYRLDGVCMDNLAYPNAEYDYSPLIIESYAKHEKLGRLPGLTELMNDDYTSWCSWRSSVIADLAGNIGNVVRRAGKGRVTFSSIVPGNSAINFREPEITGQNVELLGRSFDFLVADLPLSTRNGEMEKIPQKLLSLHLRAGKRPLWFRLIEPADPASMTPETITDAAAKLAKGSDGIGILTSVPTGNEAKIRQLFAGSAK
jgi:peptidoglycan/xylan/chitin deacetylase (PgdA/CDA1 family)